VRLGCGLCLLAEGQTGRIDFSSARVLHTLTELDVASLAPWLPVELIFFCEPVEMSGVKKRSVLICGHKTSVSLEEPFWIALRDIAEERRKFIGVLIAEIGAAQPDNNLSSAVRVFVLEHHINQANRR
jgi:predicted DNA-binding ribbon-helix-helix protein